MSGRTVIEWTKLARWTTKLKNPDTQTRLLLRLVLECANTFGMFERDDFSNEERRRYLCGRARTMTMTKLRKAMKEEPWK